MYPEAVAAVEKAVSITGGDARMFGVLGALYARMGRKDDALRVVQELQETAQRRYVPPSFLALIFIALNDLEQAFQCLDKACEEHDGWLAWMNVLPFYDDVRSDQRYEELVRRMNFPE